MLGYRRMWDVCRVVWVTQCSHQLLKNVLVEIGPVYDNRNKPLLVPDQKRVCSEIVEFLITRLQIKIVLLKYVSAKFPYLQPNCSQI